ncbi:MAG: helix-hairpin-helix domain-containing protein [Planctomycetota bacterium]
MDPLALLSNLHGDGPATLHRLRRQGCDTLSGLLSTSVEELAPVLGWEEQRTDRFLREAEALARRLGEGILDAEEREPDPVEREQVHADDGDDEVAAEESSNGAEPRLDARNGVVEEAPVDPRDKILARWRELDATEPIKADVLVPHTPTAPLKPPGTPLSAARIDGLDPGRVRALLAAGVTTIEELAEANDFELHQRSGLPFTLTSRLAFLARRVLAEQPAPEPAPPVGGGEAAGPFA